MRGKRKALPPCLSLDMGEGGHDGANPLPSPSGDSGNQKAIIFKRISDQFQVDWHAFDSVVVEAAERGHDLLWETLVYGVGGCLCDRDATQQPLQAAPFEPCERRSGQPVTMT